MAKVIDKCKVQYMYSTLIYITFEQSILHGKQISTNLPLVLHNKCIFQIAYTLNGHKLLLTYKGVVIAASYSSL